MRQGPRSASSRFIFWSNPCGFSQTRKQRLRELSGLCKVTQLVRGARSACSRPGTSPASLPCSPHPLLPLWCCHPFTQPELQVGVPPAPCCVLKLSQRLGLDSFFVVGPALCTVGCPAASLASTCQMPEVPPVTTTKNVSTHYSLPNNPLGDRETPV